MAASAVQKRKVALLSGNGRHEKWADLSEIQELESIGF